jgi:hypothetical protein
VIVESIDSEAPDRVVGRILALSHAVEPPRGASPSGVMSGR